VEANRHIAPGRGGRIRAAIATGCLLGTLLTAPASGQDNPVLPGGLVPPAGFAATVFAPADGLPTALAIGPDDRIYATVIAPDLATGWVMAWEDLGGIGGPGEQVATGLQLPLGIAFGPDGTLYVSENNTFGGPGARGLVTALQDTNDDGTFDTRQTVVGNIPNGRHQTNGLAFGEDGWLYIANGNATDDGIECGPEPIVAAECPNPEVKPWSGAILKVDPAWRDVDLLQDVVIDHAAYDDPELIGFEEVLVAEGFRNIYGLAFRADEPTMLYTVMNGSDDPASSEPIYRTDVADEQVVTDPESGASLTRPVIDDMGFPSCLYDPHPNPFPEPNIGGHDHPGDPEPEDNLNPDVIEKFGPCPADDVVRPIGFASEHSGTTGLAFVPEGNFPESYEGDLLYAEWGSLWNLNAAQKTGHAIQHARVNEDGTLGAQQEFMTLPLPMDIAFDADGVMFVADMAGAIYRVAHLG
jgi:glucose/arabinose dehydrogenase